MTCFRETQVAVFTLVLLIAGAAGGYGCGNYTGESCSAHSESADGTVIDATVSWSGDGSVYAAYSQSDSSHPKQFYRETTCRQDSPAPGCDLQFFQDLVRMQVVQGALVLKYQTAAVPIGICQ